MQETHFQLQNITLAGLESEPANGKPIILAMHGWLDNAASFVPLAPLLPGSYRLVSLDLPGHGKSSHRSPDAHYHLMDNIQDLHELFLQQDWHDVTLLGHSMGGILASVYAACFPERIKKLIIMESFGPLTLEAESSAQQLRDSVNSRLAIAAKTPRHPDSVGQAVTARMLAGKMKQESAQILMLRNLKQVDGALQYSTDRRLRTISTLRLTEAQANAFLKQIACPTLAILGEQGFEKLKRNMSKRQGVIADLTTVECPGGHHVHMDNPTDVAVKIREFLE